MRGQSPLSESGLPGPTTFLRTWDPRRFHNDLSPMGTTPTRELHEDPGEHAPALVLKAVPILSAGSDGQALQEREAPLCWLWRPDCLPFLPLLRHSLPCARVEFPSLPSFLARKSVFTSSIPGRNISRGFQFYHLLVLTSNSVNSHHLPKTLHAVSHFLGFSTSLDHQFFLVRFWGSARRLISDFLEFLLIFLG